MRVATTLAFKTILVQTVDDQPQTWESLAMSLNERGERFVRNHDIDGAIVDLGLLGALVDYKQTVDEILTNLRAAQQQIIYSYGTVWQIVIESIVEEWTT